LGPFELYSYGVLIAVGGVLSSWFWHWKRAKIGLKTDEDLWLMINAILAGGFLGGRVLFLFEYTVPFSRDFWQTMFSFNRGFSVMGAFAGVLLAIAWFARRAGVPFLRVLDYVCQAAPFWHVFGRLGCFMAGCCYGREAGGLPWAVTFVNPRSMVESRLLGVPVHPTQLYEALGDLVIAAGLYMLVLPKVEKGRWPRGSVCAAYFLSYGLLRFSIEFYRGDVVPFWLGLTAAQAASLSLAGAALGVIFYGRRRSACTQS
jgi:phosphatidylglycerol:prolipoprotein diacylglycerol transferase